MPPPSPPQPPLGTGRIVSRGETCLLSYYDMDVAGVVALENGFDARAYWGRLVTLCDSLDEKISLAAMREFRAARRELLLVNGLLGQVKAESRTSDPSGDRKVATVTTTLLARLSPVPITPPSLDRHPPVHSRVVSPPELESPDAQPIPPE